MREFKSFFKTVGGNEGDKCRYPTRLDTYGCGCAHNCSYCYARSLLAFRNLWNPNDPSVANIEKIKQKLRTLPAGTVVRLGGMTDCFQPCELKHHITYQTIELLNQYNIHYLIVTKSHLVATDEYLAILDPNLAHIQITVTCTNDEQASSYESASPPSMRIAAIDRLARAGFDIQLRLSPFIPDHIDFSCFEAITCNKVIVEFLRVTPWIKQWFNIDYGRYVHQENGYWHLPLEEKIAALQLVTGFRDVSVCEDCTEHYAYWKANVNANALDCCNLRF